MKNAFSRGEDGNFAEAPGGAAPRFHHKILWVTYRSTFSPLLPPFSVEIFRPESFDSTFARAREF